jgi:ABC-type Fe3+/spermidine/putrescine transport system ATPase subunit
MSIILKNIYKTIGKKTILNNLYLEVKQGEFHVVLGPSGEGKSTLLSIIAGLIKPDKGKIFINDQLINDLPPQKRNVGFVFQDYALFPHLTVYENVTYGLRTKKESRRNIAETARQYLELVQLQEHQNKYPSELSGGQKQRVALARALATQPQVLLLDEPLSHLDACQRERLKSELKHIQQKTGITTIYVTHDQAEAMYLADKISVLHKGRVEQTEPPEEIFYRPKTPFVAGFVGITNILKGKILNDNGEIVQVAVSYNDEPTAEPLIIRVKKRPIFEGKKEISLCLHPENIVLSPTPQMENAFACKIEKVLFQGAVLKIIINVSGHELQSIVAKNIFNPVMVQDSSVYACFSPDAIHPLCGKCRRAPLHLRSCMQANA